MDEHLALFSESLPVNPLPFLYNLIELIKEKGTDAIRSDEAKALLWVVNAQCYGQMAIIDLCMEWDRLKAVFKPTD